MTQPDPSSVADNRTIEISDPAQLPETPLVSIYMLTYNHERYIAEAIEGVIAQEREFPIELIIGEDCSTDRTPDIVRAYQEQHPDFIRILTSATNVGAHANSARCINATRGEFVAICEGDDYWHHPQKLRMEIQQLVENPQAQLIHTDYDRRIGERILRSANKQIDQAALAQGDAFLKLLRRMTVTTATSMYRRQLLMDYMDSEIDPRSWPFGDYPKALYAALHGPVIYIPTSTATYRLAEGSAMNQGRSKSLQMQYAGLECRELFMKIRCLPEDIQLDIKSISHRIIMRHAVLAGDMDVYNEQLAWLASNNLPLHKTEHFIASKMINYPLLLKAYRTFRRAWREIEFIMRSEAIH